MIFKESDEVLVLVHGYGGGSGLFYKIVPMLCKYFKIYMIDLLGMGGSSRPDFRETDAKLTEDFFVESIE